MKNSLCIAISTLALPIALIGCGSTTAKNEEPGQSAQGTGLNAQQSRITESPILADRRNLESLQERLRKLNEAGVRQNYYPLAKAQCWLDTAKTQYHENDRTGYIEESMTESQKIIQTLEANNNAKVGYDTPHVARSTRLRDDLWAQLSKFKDNEPALFCNARTVACAEIRLVRAGHAQEQTGWRAATPHVMMAEDAIQRAAQEATRCAAPVVVATATPLAVPVVPTPALAALEKETYVLLSDALYRFDKYGRDEMLPGGKERLASIAQRLKSYKSIDSLTVIGHTDRLGSDSYNDPLSANRANTVKQLLDALGVKATKSEAVGKGKRDPVVTNCSDKLSREKLISCLQPDRRVTIEVRGIVK